MRLGWTWRPSIAQPEEERAHAANGPFHGASSPDQARATLQFLVSCGQVTTLSMVFTWSSGAWGLGAAREIITSLYSLPIYFLPDDPCPDNRRESESLANAFMRAWRSIDRGAVASSTQMAHAQMGTHSARALSHLACSTSASREQPITRQGLQTRQAGAHRDNLVARARNNSSSSSNSLGIDDLERIKGVGPAYANLLKSKQITTVSMLLNLYHLNFKGDKLELRRYLTVSILLSACVQAHRICMCVHEAVHMVRCPLLGMIACICELTLFGTFNAGCLRVLSHT